LAAVVAVVLGCAIRVVQWAGRRSLWLDEASLAFNIVHRSWGDLMKPLTFRQGAPLGFLWIERGAVLGLGNNEYALRLWPLVCGCLAVELTRRVSGRLFGPRSALLATALVAVSPTMIRYSNEVKQYSTDAAAALLVVLCGLRVCERASLRRWVELAVVCAVSLWVSHPATFVIAGVGAFLVGRAAARRRWSDVRNAALVAVVVGSSFLKLYQVSLRKLGDDPVLLTFWQDGFAPRPLAAGSLLRWISSASVRAVEHPLGARLAVLWAAVFVGGVVVAVRHRPRAVILLAPLAVTVVAAVAGRYPFQDRLILFLVAPAIITASGVVAWASGPQLPRRLALVGALVVVAATLGPSVGTGSSRIYRIQTVNEARPVFQYAARHAEPSDEVLVFFGSQPAYYYYQHIAGLQADWDLYPTEPSEDCRPLDVTGRVWVVFGFDYVRRSVVLDELRTIGRLVDRKEYPGAGAYLFDLTSAATTRPVCLKLQEPLNFGRANLGTRPFATGATS
jgi:4-amino-4-deoxy-L-arabinose transferase-like glycosyltransferase